MLRRRVQITFKNFNTPSELTTKPEIYAIGASIDYKI
jgi:hypothetical protein